MSRLPTVLLLTLLLIPASSRAEILFSDAPAWRSPVLDTRNVAVGDVDGDGDLDLVIARIDGPTLLYLNDGGAFGSTPAWQGPVETTRAVVLGDLDGDGDLDLVRGNSGEGSTIYLNTGGTFAAAASWHGQSDLTRAISLGDVDGDGGLDLVCGNLDGGSKLYRNVGATFETTPTWTGPAAATNAVALGDLNGDGRLDLVLGNFAQPSELFLNTGSTFATMAAWSGSVEPTRGVALGDVNGDGTLDLVCGNLGTGATLTLNTGGVLDAAPSWTAPAESTWAVALGDVDGDGRIDLMRGNSQRGCTLYLNVGGTFPAAPAWSGPVEDNRSLALADLDGDGDLDLVRGNLDQAATIHWNVSSPLSPQPVWTGVAEPTRAAVWGDVDGDGDLDLVRGNLGAGATLYRNANGVLAVTPAWIGPAENTVAMAMGDVDGDGHLDLVRGNIDQGATLYLNHDGTFDAAATWTGQVGNTRSVTLGDVDGDGDLDLVCGNFGQGATFYRNIGGTFETAPIWTGAVENTYAVALGDVDGDGRLDLVRGNDGGATLTLGAAAAFAATPSWIGPIEHTFAIGLGDVNGDGVLDLVRGNFGQSATLYLGGPGGFGGSPAWSGQVENTASLALADLDGDGDLDLLRGNVDAPATIYVNDGTTFSAQPAATMPVMGDTTWAVALADVDGDGDLDAVLGDLELHLNRSPWIRGNGASHDLPDNSGHLRWASAKTAGPNHYTIDLTAVDAESDPLRLLAEYQFAGSRQWRPMTLDGSAAPSAPLTTSPAGVAHQLDWDVTKTPFDPRDVVVRLRALSTPRVVASTAFVTSFLTSPGLVIPVRPSLDASPASLSFPTVTVGDTAEVVLQIGNRGNQDLVIGSIQSPSPAVTVLGGAGLTVPPSSSQSVTVRLAPRTVPPSLGSIQIVANDPAKPSVDVALAVDVRALSFTAQLLAVAPELPLGQAATIVVTPAPQVRLETGFVFFRPHGASSFGDSARLVPQGSSFIALIPSQGVTEAGLDYYVRVENSGVVAVSPAGAPTSFFFQPVASPLGALASPIPDGRGVFPSGRGTPIVVTLPEGSRFQDGALYFRIGGAAAYDSLPLQPLEISPGIVSPSTTIPDSVVGPRGLEYWVRVRTLSQSLTDPSTAPETSPRMLRVTVDRLREPASHTGKHYRLMTVPLDLDLPATGTLEALLSDQAEFGPANNTRWRAFRYVPALAGYLEVTGTADARLHPEPGRGFWLIGADDNRVDTAPVPGRSTPTNLPFHIALEPGWNMIGNPYDFPVAWSDVIAASGGLAVEPPVPWNEALDAYDAADVFTLMPFEGYWVLNAGATTVELLVPPIASPVVVRAPARAAAADALDWRIAIEARAGDRADLRNVAGVDPRATDGADGLDRTDPPAAPGGLSLYFLDPAAGSAARTIDLRAPIEAAGEAASRGRRWVFDVARGDEAPSAEARLSFAGLDGVPEGLGVRLLDRALDRVVDLRAEPGYSFVSTRRTRVKSAGEARFELLAGSAEFLNAAAQPPVAFETRLLPVFPNPVRDDATVRFELARAGPARLELFDLAGRRVWRIERSLDAGRHEVVLTGRDDDGRTLAAGVYTLRLNASDRAHTVRLVKL